MIETIFQWMQQLYEALGSTTQISSWVYLLVAAGGVASALSPCYVPVLTMFGGYVGGYAVRSRRGGLRLAIPFVLGNALSLAVVGGVASLMGKSVLQVFTGYELDRWIPGVVGSLMGLQLLGILQLKMPVMPIFRWVQRGPDTVWGSFGLGLPFGLVVTPCTMPIFFAIVSFITVQGSIFHGALLMMAYAFGRGAILTAVAGFVGILKSLNVAEASHFIERISGILILLASIALLLFYKDFLQWTMQSMSGVSVR